MLLPISHIRFSLSAVFPIIIMKIHISNYTTLIGLYLAYKLQTTQKIVADPKANCTMYLELIYIFKCNRIFE